MRVAAVLADGAVGPLDEILQFGLPLLILVGLYWWTSRKPKGGSKK